MKRLVVCFLSTLLLVGLNTSHARAADYFLDPRGRRVDFAPLYEAWFGPDRYPRRYGPAIAENVALLALELAIYWHNPDSSAVDWEYIDLGAKLSSREAIRFDDNMHRTNMLLHPFAGSLHYGFTRVNGFGIPASFGAAAASSAVYEALLEWKEIISINDLIVTPFGGMAAGEFFVQLANYVNSESPRPRKLDEVVGAGAFARTASAMSVGLPRRVHNELDPPPYPPDVPDDNLGLSSAYAHDFGVFLGADVITNDLGDVEGVGVGDIEAKIVAMPGFLRPGRISAWFWEGNFTSFDLRIAANDRVQDVDLEFGAHLLGYFDQRMTAVRGGVRGQTHEIALWTGLRYVDRWLLDRRDHYGILHLPGAVWSAWVRHGKSRLEFSVEASPDYAAVRSLGYGQWVARFGEEGTKTSLQRNGYYHAWGVSARARTSLTVHDTTLDFRSGYGRYESIDGLERESVKVTREVHASDDILELSTGLSWKPLTYGPSLRLEASHFFRRSAMDPFGASRSDQRAGAAMGARF